MSFPSGSYSDHKTSVRAATDAVLPAYTHLAGVLTASANGALPAIDTVALAVRDRVLVKDETAGNAPFNGLYQVTDLGSAGTPWILSRTQDGDQQHEISAGMITSVEEGTTNNDIIFLLSTDNPITIGVTDLAFVMSGGGGAFVPLAGGTMTGPLGIGPTATPGPYLDIESQSINDIILKGRKNNAPDFNEIRLLAYGLQFGANSVVDWSLTRTSASIMTMATGDAIYSDSDPLSLDALSRRGYVDAQRDSRVATAGDTMTGNLVMASNVDINMQGPSGSVTFTGGGMLATTGAAGSATLISSQVTAEAASRFKGTYDGTISWGDGTLAHDTTLARTGAGTLKITGGLDTTDDINVGTNKIQLQEASGAVVLLDGDSHIAIQKQTGPNSPVMNLAVTGDATNRWQVTGGGKTQLGDGAVSPDAGYERSAPNILKMLTGDKWQQATAPSAGDDLVNLTYADGAYVEVTGDTMTGNLTFSSGADVLLGANTTIFSDETNVVGQAALRLKATGSTGDNFFMTVGGKMLWRDAVGGAGSEMVLEHVATGTLGINDAGGAGALQVGDYGNISSGDYTVIGERGLDLFNAVDAEPRFRIENSASPAIRFQNGDGTDDASIIFSGISNRMTFAFPNGDFFFDDNIYQSNSGGGSFYVGDPSGNSAGGFQHRGTDVATRVAFAGKVTGDTTNRWQVLGNGKIEWADGTLGVDTDLARTGVAKLTTSGGLGVHGVTPPAQAAAIAAPTDLASAIVAIDALRVALSGVGITA